VLKVTSFLTQVQAFVDIDVQVPNTTKILVGSERLLRKRKNRGNNKERNKNVRGETFRNVVDLLEGEQRRGSRLLHV